MVYTALCLRGSFESEVRFALLTAEMKIQLVKPLHSNGPKIRMPRVKHANLLYPKLEVKVTQRKGEFIPAHTNIFIIIV